MYEFFPDSAKKSMPELIKESKELFHSESRLLMLGSKPYKKISKKLMHKITSKYSKNIILNDFVERRNSNQLVKIYKNLISDIRIHYNNKFMAFLG